MHIKLTDKEKNVRDKIKKTAGIIMLAAGLICLLAGCGKSEKDTKLTEQIVGSWQENMDDGTKVMTFRNDMTFTESINITGTVPMSTQSNGTFSVKGNKISIKYEEYGLISDYTVNVNGNSMTLDNGSGKIVMTKK